MSERYARQIRREYRRLISHAVVIVKTQVENMSFSQRIKLAANIIFRKCFEAEKEL